MKLIVIDKSPFFLVQDRDLSDMAYAISDRIDRYKEELSKIDVDDFNSRVFDKIECLNELISRDEKLLARIRVVQTEAYYFIVGKGV